MQATTIPNQPALNTGLLGAPAGELVLKICGGEHDGRVLRLNAAKCTIGSAPGCTLRLRARGIRPVHALILRGPTAAIVRCWSPDAQLNERGFTEAQLEMGDKLQFGPISLSVVELATETQPRQVQLPALPTGEANPQPRPMRRPNRNRRKQLFNAFREERRQQTDLQSTIDGQLEQLSALQQQLDQLQVEMSVAPVEVIPPVEPINDLLTQQLTRTIEQLRHELDSAAKRRIQEQQSLARQKAAWEEQSEQRLQVELAKLRTELQLQQQQASAAAAASCVYERQIEALGQQRITLTREIESLKLALQTKSKSEELARQNAAAQLEQLSQTFALVSRERDELFEQLHAEESARQATAPNWQAQIEEVRQRAEAQIAEAQIAAQLQISKLREEFAKREHQLDEELIARTTNESQRSVTDAERIQKLTAELESVRSEARQANNTAQQQQEGFTQARKRWESEIAALNQRLQESELAVHAARTNSGELQAAVLAEAEQARAQRDAVREQMLRQQQDWTEFRSRLESAASEERELARVRYAAIEEELNARTQDFSKAQSECLALQERVENLQIELEQAQESLFAAEHGVNQRLQQMTVSMESLELDRGSVQSQIERERAEWEVERDSLATCVTELQHELAKLTEKLQAFEQQSQHANSDAQLRISTTETKLQAAQEQLSQWQTAAEEAQQHVDELSHKVAKFQQHEQAWQLEREQLDQQQQDSTSRLQQLEASITELQQQLDEAQRAVAVTCPPPGRMSPSSDPPEPAFGSTININNQELAALCEQRLDGGLHAPQANEFGGTININDQELAALCEQRNDAVPSLLAPRGPAEFDPEQLAMFRVREEDLQSRADELVQQQQQLEEEQANVARQRIELESFHASLVEMEKSLTERAQALLQQSAGHPQQVPPTDDVVSQDYHDQQYVGEPERESNPLSESEAFAAMADQLAAMQLPKKDGPPALTRSPQEAVPANEINYDTPSPLSPFGEHESTCNPEAASQDFSPAQAEAEQEPGESLIVSTPAAGDQLSEPSFENQSAADAGGEPTVPSGIVEPASEEDFDRQLDARIARVMRRESSDWQTQRAAEVKAEHDSSDPNATAEEPSPSGSQAVNSVLDRLREAGLWKGEGTAKADQVPSSNHPLDEGGPSLRRLSESGPIAAEAPSEAPLESLSTEVEVEASESEESSPISNPNPPRASLANSPAKDDDADDSIESYMSRLMQRLRTTEDEPTPRKTNGSPQARQSQSAPVAAQPPKPKLTDSKPLTSLEEMAPRSQAPELSSNLAAMRELANSAARGAIAVHQKQNKRQKVNLRSANTLLALLVSAGLLFFWTRTGSWIAMGGVSLSLLWAIGSCLVAVMQSLTLRKADRKEQDNGGDEEASE